MIVYGVVFSPFVQRVLLAAKLKGHVLELHPPHGRRLDSAEHLAISPLGRIPVLEDGGWTCAESAVIVAYLDEVLDGPALLEGNAREKAHVRLVERFADVEVAAGARHYFINRPYVGNEREVFQRFGRAQILDGLRAIETVRDPKHSHAAGDRPSRADAALLPFLSFLEISSRTALGPDLLDPTPGIADYWRRMKSGVAGPMMQDMQDGFARFLARAQQQAQQQ